MHLMEALNQEYTFAILTSVESGEQIFFVDCKISTQEFYQKELNKRIVKGLIE